MRSGGDLANIRTDVVGSLLRPAAVREARVAFDDGRLSLEALRAIEDEAVQDAVRLQEDLGLDVVTDGEMRRLNFQDSFRRLGRRLRHRALDFEGVRTAD